MQCKSILIVEDEEIIRENLKALLELEGYFVYTASNRRGPSHPPYNLAPYLVLLDLLMPVMNGMEFLEAKKT